MAAGGTVATGAAGTAAGRGGRGRRERGIAAIAAGAMGTTRHQFAGLDRPTMGAYGQIISKNEFFKILATFGASVFIDGHV